MNARQLSRYFQAARKDRSRQNFREYFRCPNNTQVLCESESEYRLWESFTEGLETKQIDLNRVSIRGLFEEFIPGGREIVDSWNPRHGGGGISLTEAAGAIDTALFSNITGQVVYNAQRGEFLAVWDEVGAATSYDPYYRVVTLARNSSGVVGVGVLPPATPAAWPPVLLSGS
jgi:hypothetical protein